MPKEVMDAMVKKTKAEIFVEVVKSNPDYPD